MSYLMAENSAKSSTSSRFSSKAKPNKFLKGESEDDGTVGTVDGVVGDDVGAGVTALSIHRA
jgi:hypothetical protein